MDFSFHANSENNKKNRIRQTIDFEHDLIQARHSFIQLFYINFFYTNFLYSLFFTSIFLIRRVFFNISQKKKFFWFFCFIFFFGFLFFCFFNFLCSFGLILRSLRFFRKLDYINSLFGLLREDLVGCSIKYIQLFNHISYIIFSWFLLTLFYR